MENQITFTRAGKGEHIAVVTMNRPDKLNALTKVMEAQLRETMEAVDRDDSIRVVVLTGAGKGFCAGMDINELEVLPPDDIRGAQWMRPFDMNRRADYQTRYGYFPAMRKPVIAAINGAAAGLGLVFALYSDMRFASSSTAFSTAFARRGLIAEHGISWLLPRVVGPGHAADLLYSARKVLADEALRIGLVDRVFEPDDLLDQTLDYADDLARNVSPRSIRVMKRQMWEQPFQSLAEATRMANAEMFDSIQSEDFREGVAHFIERRQANFTGK
ncbi:enoyl-CoA hydratase [Cupriavidus sp. WGlv3]|uniref:enoyl-CoA hydratase n=1 Tax=Cupriavidus sp. WGlv3 TaxID=2919924 RepID=UPI002090002F|nr:enoyl-CoA hydratase [Cupriavidus sp. WGlv3]MCO4860871.1 enoyl-CoA hydratase [Cupriavidus sp. WGlv3]